MRLPSGLALLVAVLATGLLHVWPPAPHAASRGARRPPNVVLIISDDKG